MRLLKRIVPVIIAAFLLGGVMPLLILSAKPAHAIGSACYFSDWQNTWYWDGNQEADHDITDIGVGVVHVHFAITAYRYSDSNGNCWRQYVWEVWNDGTPNENADIIVGGRVWACGVYQGTWWVEVRGAATGAASSPVIGYGPGPCGRQVDDFRSYETPWSAQNWSLWPDTYTNFNPNWYTSFNS